MLQRENVLEIFKKQQLLNINEIIIEEISFNTKINLRGNINDKKFISLIEEELDISLPTQPNTYTKQKDKNIIWLSPSEWLITLNGETNKNKIIKLLNNSVGFLESSVTDVSENKTIIRAKGKNLYTLLSKFLTLDLDKSFEKEYTAAQTLFVKVPVLLVRKNNKDTNPVIDIFVNRSHANYIFELLIDGTKNLNF